MQLTRTFLQINAKVKTKIAISRIGDFVRGS